MSLVQDRIGAKGTNDTQVTYQIFDRESTKNGSPRTKSFNLSYDAIQNAWLKVDLLADTVGTIANAPVILGGGYKLTKIVVNGHEFKPSSAQNSLNLLQDLYTADPNLQNVLKNSGENFISISFEAPLGAGVISPNAQINASLIVLGTETIASKIGFSGLPSVSDFMTQLQDWINNNVPTFIAILALIAIIIGAIAYLLGGKIPKVG